MSSKVGRPDGNYALSTQRVAMNVWKRRARPPRWPEVRRIADAHGAIPNNFVDKSPPMVIVVVVRRFLTPYRAFLQNHMPRHDDRPTRRHVTPGHGLPERHSSVRVGRSPRSMSWPVGVIAGFVIVAGLAELMPEHVAPEPEAQIWVSTSSDTGAIDRLVFSPDGKQIASVDSNFHAVLWDVATGQRSEGPGGLLDDIRSLAISPGGDLLALGLLDSRVLLWDFATRQVRVGTSRPYRRECATWRSRPTARHWLRWIQRAR